MPPATTQDGSCRTIAVYALLIGTKLIQIGQFYDSVSRSDDQRHSTFGFQNETDGFAHWDTTRIDIKSEFAEEVGEDHFIFVSGEFQP